MQYRTRRSVTGGKRLVLSYGTAAGAADVITGKPRMELVVEERRRAFAGRAIVSHRGDLIVSFITLPAFPRGERRALILGATLFLLFAWPRCCRLALGLLAQACSFAPSICRNTQF